MSMPPGTYYIGDLCYVMHDVWNEVCDLTIEDHTCKEGEFQLSDGRRFALYNTAYGDGTYDSNGYGEFCVDAGSIGCIMKCDIRDDTYTNIESFGALVEFPDEFNTRNNRGELCFGHVVMATSAEDEE